VTEYKLNRFTMADAQALAGKTADITAWDDDEPGTRVTYPGAKVTGIIVLIGPYLVIETAGAVMTSARTGEQLGARPPEPELHLLLTLVCEVSNVRGRFERGDRVALEYTADPDTRLRPGDEGTVTRYDPKLAQFSDHSTIERLLTCRFTSRTCPRRWLAGSARRGARGVVLVML
jgi:hypothetical protein